MTVKNSNLWSLLKANELIVSVPQLKRELPKSLIVVHSAQKNYKTLVKHYNDFQNDLEALRKEAANKDEKGAPIIKPDPANPKVNIYDIPEERMKEFQDTAKMIEEKTIDIHLSVFSEESGEVIIKYLDGGQTDAFLDFLLEKKEENADKAPEKKG